MDHGSLRVRYGIVKIILQLLVSNHIIACLWFYIGSQESPDSSALQGFPARATPFSWVFKPPNAIPHDFLAFFAGWVEEINLSAQPAKFQYATSLHWAITQLGVGQTEIEAVNLDERIFSIVISHQSTGTGPRGLGHS